MGNSSFQRTLAIVKPFLRIFVIVAIIVAIILLIDSSSKNSEVRRKKFVLIQYNDSPLSELSGQGIVDGLTANSMVQGKDYELAVSNAQGDIATLNLMMDAVVSDKPDMVFVTSTPTLQAAAKKIKDIPVIFTVVADPLLAGVGTFFESHQPNVTGISTLGDYEGMIKWVKIVLPSARVIGTIFSPGESNSVKNMGELKKYAEKAGLKLLTTPINSSQEITDATLSLVNQQPDVICQVVDNFTAAAASTIITTAKQHNIPVFGFVSDQSEKGAVLVVSRDYHQAGVDAVRLAKKILDGQDPSKIPFEFVSKTKLIVNLPAAAFFKIKFPDDLLKHPDIIITK